MRFVAISDFHITDRFDPAYSKVIDFLKSEVCQEVDVIIFLGDMFDLMAGCHNAYIKEYQEFFNQITVILNLGKTVAYLEGNHDVHLNKLFKVACSGASGFVNVHKKFIIKDYNDHKILFSHGDELLSNDPAYSLYKKIITSPPLEFLADYLLPYSMLHAIGARASKNSRKRHENNYTEDVESDIRSNLRSGVEAQWKLNNFDLAIVGHSHILDEYVSPSGFKYYNISGPKGCFKYFDSDGLVVKEMP